MLFFGSETNSLCIQDKCLVKGVHSVHVHTLYIPGMYMYTHPSKAVVAQHWYV